MINKEFYELIKKTKLFEKADKEKLERFMGSDDCKSVCFSGGEEIKASNSLIIILSGAVKVCSRDERRNLLLRTVEKGGMLGAAGVFNSRRPISRLFAKGKTEVALIGRESILQLMREDESVMISFVSFLSDRIEYLNSKITIITAGSAERKLALYILQTKEDTAELPVSLMALSDMLDIGRASLYRTLDTFVSDGCIKRQGNRITILDRNKLENY